jgi:integrase
MLMAMPKRLYPGLVKEVTRHGTDAWYVRPLHHGKRIRIRAEYGTDAFMAEYQDALQGAAAVKPLGATGSLSWLWGRYRASNVWRGLSPATRRARENIMAAVLKESSEVPCGKIRRKDVEATRDKFTAPNQARAMLDTLRGLFRWAAAAHPEQVREDPTIGVKNPPAPKNNGFPVWSETEVDAYQAKWPVGTRERVWIDVLLYSGLRRGDAVTLGRQHVKDGMFTIRTEKSGMQVEVSNPILPVLAATLKAGPCGTMLFITGSNGNGMVKESFGNAFRKACRLAGVHGKSAHGLRKVAATRCAENGATTSQLMALFGWISPKQAELYTRSADRRRLARAAGATMQRTDDGQSSPAPSEEVRAETSIA